MKTSHFLAVLLSLSASAYSVAQAPDKRFEAQASLGILNNSTLIVAELDQVSNEQDMAFTFHAKLAGQWQARPALKLQGAYLFARKDYQEFDGYNLDLHQVYVDGQYDFAALSVGIRHDFAYAILQDQAFLRLNQSSLYTAKYITPTTYLRSAFNYKTKHFDSMNARDATNQGVGLNLFQFFNQGSTMLSLGLNVEKEQAVDTQFDFNANSLSAGIQSDSVACLGNGRWQVKATSFSQVEQNGAQYRTASKSNPFLDVVIDQIIEGAALNKQQEREAINKAWTNNSH